MSATVIWMDHQQAKLFHLSAGARVKVEELKHHPKNHHTHSPKEEKHASDAFFHEILPHLVNAQEILLMGPGTAKSEFKHHLERHGHHEVAKKVVGVETVDHPTQNQVLEIARKFFKSRDLFTDPIR